MSDTATLLRQVRLALQGDDLDTAIGALTELIALANAAGDQGALARHHGNLALLYHRRAQAEGALAHLETALGHARAEGDEAMEAGLLGNAGNVLRDLRRYDEAIRALQGALALAVDQHDERGRGIWLANLGLVYDDMGNTAYAIAHHEQSIKVARMLRDLRGLAGRLGNLAQSCMAHGDPPTALIHLQEAVMIYRDLGDKGQLARQLGIIGNLYVVLGEKTATQTGRYYLYSRAIEHYRQALPAAYEAGDVTMQADLLRAIGEVALAMGEYNDAINHLDSAYGMFSGLGIADALPSIEMALAQARQARMQAV